MAANDPGDPYEVLGVHPDARPAEVRWAYRRAARRHHPDRTGESSGPKWEAANRRMAEITAAWQILKDPARRAEYDLRRAEREQQADRTRAEQQRAAEQEWRAEQRWRDHEERRRTEQEEEVERQRRAERRRHAEQQAEQAKREWHRRHAERAEQRRQAEQRGEQRRRDHEERRRTEQEEEVERQRRAERRRHAEQQAEQAKREWHRRHAERAEQRRQAEQRGRTKSRTGDGRSSQPDRRVASLWDVDTVPIHVGLFLLLSLALVAGLRLVPILPSDAGSKSAGVQPPPAVLDLAGAEVREVVVLVEIEFAESFGDVPPCGISEEVLQDDAERVLRSGNINVVAFDTFGNSAPSSYLPHVLALYARVDESPMASSCSARYFSVFWAVDPAPDGPRVSWVWGSATRTVTGHWNRLAGPLRVWVFEDAAVLAGAILAGPSQPDP